MTLWNQELVGMIELRGRVCGGGGGGGERERTGMRWEMSVQQRLLGGGGGSSQRLV